MSVEIFQSTCRYPCQHIQIEIKGFPVHTTVIIACKDHVTNLGIWALFAFS